MVNSSTPMSVISVLAPNLAKTIESFIDEIKSLNTFESIALPDISSRLKLESAELLTAVDNIIFAYEDKLSAIKTQEQELNIKFLEASARSPERNAAKIEFVKVSMAKEKCQNDMNVWQHIFDMLQRYDFALKSSVADRKFIPSTAEGG